MSEREREIKRARERDREGADHHEKCTSRFKTEMFINFTRGHSGKTEH